MARVLSATDLAIALASRKGTLMLIEHPSRFGDTYVAITDTVGLIEVHNTMAEAEARVAAIRQAVS